MDRWECYRLRRLSERSSWVLVYGRRKTGKTWLLRRCWAWDVYITVSIDGACVVEDAKGSVHVKPVGECFRSLMQLLRHGSGVVIDEFQRLPQSYWDLLASVAADADSGLAVCGSSFRLARQVFDRRSPLLGLFQPFPIGLVSVYDAIHSLKQYGLSDRDAVLWSIVARDPWLLRHIEPGGEPWRRILGEAEVLAPIARGLIGEVFEDEERQLARIYDAALTLLSLGYWRAADIAQKLYDAGLLSTPSPSSATGVLAVLEAMGLVERIPLWRTRRARVYYRHRSSLLSLLYRIAARMNSHGTPPSMDMIRSMYGLELQFNLAELLAARRGLRRAYAILPDGSDIDAVLLGKKKPEWGYEIKMSSITVNEALKAIERITSYGIPRAGIVALEGLKPGEPRQPIEELLDSSSIVREAERLSRRARENTANTIPKSTLHTA